MRMWFLCRIVALLGLYLVWERSWRIRMTFIPAKDDPGIIDMPEYVYNGRWKNGKSMEKDLEDLVSFVDASFDELGGYRG